MGSSKHGLLQDMQCIGRKEGFEVFSNIFQGGAIVCGRAIHDLLPFEKESFWAQDIWTFGKNKLISKCDLLETQPACDTFGLKNCMVEDHIAGGNIFFVNNDGEDELLVGVDVLKILSIGEVKERYDVGTVNVLPQFDFHLDLFIRPLADKKILVADDMMSCNILEKGLKMFKNYIKGREKENNGISNVILFNFQMLISRFKDEMNKNKLIQTNVTKTLLKDAGYEPISVPGRVYKASFNAPDGVYYPLHDCNYLNANVFINKDEDLVYITNKSKIDKFLGLETEFTKDFDFRFEKEFIKSIEPYVNPNKVYFVRGEDDFVAETMLSKMQGGIHCACSEIPVG